MRRWNVIVMLLAVALQAAAIPYDARRDSAHYIDGTRIYPDTVIYQGMNLKLDLGSAILAPATSKGKIWDASVAMNWRLKQRYYPTLELGYSKMEGPKDSLYHTGQGGYARVGLDINGLKKHPERIDALLIGVRICTAAQDYELTGYPHKFRWDCWGEVVAGCQIQIVAGFTMGWSARLKYLFTEKAYGPIPEPEYVPGFGEFKGLNWGFSYYVGYKF